MRRKLSRVLDRAMIYFSNDWNYGLAYLYIPLRFTGAQGWQISWHQTLRENMDFNVCIGFFTQQKVKTFKDVRKHTGYSQRQRRSEKKRIMTEKEMVKIKFAKGISIIRD